jgi:hypothetical protein
MPVARDTTSAISSAPTWVRSSLRPFALRPGRRFLGLGFLQALFQLGQLAVLQLGHLVEVALALQVLDLRAAVDLFLDLGEPWARWPSRPSRSPRGRRTPLELGDLVLDQARRFLRGLVLLLAHRLALDLQLDQAAVELVHHLGLGVDLHLDAAAASSIRSMALSGRKRSVM